MARLAAAKPSHPVLILLALPWLLLLLDRDWPYATLIHDPWIYLGHAIDPWGMLSQINKDYDRHYYYTSRLSIIIPLAAAHAILPAIMANLMVRLILFEVCVLSVYDLIARGIGRKTGLLTAFILGTQYFFLDAIARDYSDGYGIAYMLAAIWTASRAGSGWRGFAASAVSGACVVALVTANLAYMMLAPIPVVVYLMTRRPERGATSLAFDVAAFSLGAIALFVSFCLFYYVGTGDFWYLGPSFAFARAFRESTNPLLNNGLSIFKFGGVAWIGAAVWLALPIAVMVASSLFLMNPLKGKPTGVARLWPALFLSQFFLFVAWDTLTATGIFLQAWFYSSMLFPLLILAIGSLMGRMVESLSEPLYRTSFGISALVLLAQTAIPVTQTFPHPETRSTLWLATAPAFVALVMLLLGSKKGRVPTAVLVITAMTLLAGSTYLARREFSEELSIPVFRLTHTSAWTAQFLKAKQLRPLVQRIHEYDGRRMEAYLSIVDALRYAESLDIKDNLLFWFDMADPNAMIYDNLACCRNWSANIINFWFPSLDEEPGLNKPPRIEPGRPVAVLSVRDDADQYARRALARLGFEMRLLGQKKIQHGDITFTVHVIEAVKR